MHHRVKRTQLYLDEETARVLAAESRGTTVSRLVRDAVASHLRHYPMRDLKKLRV
jgi:hypothetical protein